LNKHPFNERDINDDMIEQGQSSNSSDNLGAKSQLLLGKSENQSLEDAKAGEPMLTLALISLGGRPVLVSPNDDDPLVYQDAVDVVDAVEYERPDSGPGHVEDGGGDVLKLKSRQQAVGYWMIRDPIPQIELPTEKRKKELRKELAD
jgi:hypothetical protein